MNVLIIDPASTTGYCVFRVDGDTADIIKWGFIEIEDKPYDGDRYIDISSQVEQIIKDNDINQVAIEDYFFSRKSSQGSTLNCAYRAVIHMKCRELDIHYDILNITLWKKFINSGKSRPTKEQKKKWGNEASKKLMTQEALWNKWNIRFPNHSISNKTGKPIKFKYDIVDAVGMAIYHACIYLNLKNIKYSVIRNKDVIFKTVPKGTFDYGGLDVEEEELGKSFN
jgi:Holliday junction resolvasome RuvABC endonuclease subunit